MKGIKTDPETDALNVEDEGMSSAQEAVPVPLFWGKRKIALRFITDIVSQEAVEAEGRAGKK